ncbi:unnamed protein product [Protopolystoma xenopodis]|uniref:Dynein heavy chain linker domain-containing protein n=1 Tax=Protopolystoma xenopodis TaxID=117903 RepID=A0A448WRH5_9PLAT|nr:unnamed protein product [Protopolystoma xenopodis]
MLSSLQDTPFFDVFADRATSWSLRLGELDQILCAFQAVQRRWVYLEPIFERGALPREAVRFARVDTAFRTLLSRVHADPRVVSLAPTTVATGPSSGMTARTGLRSGAGGLREQLADMQVRPSYWAFLNRSVIQP